MKTCNDIFLELEVLWDKFQKNHNRFITKNVPAAGARARRNINEIKKLATTYRSICLHESRKNNENT